MTKALLPAIFVITLLGACSDRYQEQDPTAVEKLNRSSVPGKSGGVQEQDREAIKERNRVAVSKIAEAEAELGRLGGAFKVKISDTPAYENYSPSSYYTRHSVEVIIDQDPRLAEKASALTVESFVNAYSAFYIAAGEAIKLGAVTGDERISSELKQNLAFQIGYPKIHDKLVLSEDRMTKALKALGYRVALSSISSTWSTETTVPSFTDFDASRLELEQSLQAYLALSAQFPLELLARTTFESETKAQPSDLSRVYRDLGMRLPQPEKPPSFASVYGKYATPSYATERNAKVSSIETFLARVATEQDCEDYRSELEKANHAKAVDVERTSFSQIEAELRGVGVVFVRDQNGRMAVDPEARLKHLKEHRFESKDRSLDSQRSKFRDAGISLKKLLRQTDGNAAEIAVIDDKTSALNDLIRSEGR